MTSTEIAITHTSGGPQRSRTDCRKCPAQLEPAQRLPLWSALVLGLCLVASGCNGGSANRVKDETAPQSVHRIDQLRPDAPELAQPGDHAVGVRSMTLVHRDQIDLLALEAMVAEQGPLNPATVDLPRSDRELPIEVWYPAIGGGVALPTEVYLRDGATKVLIAGRAVRDASASDNRGPFPLVLVSHGYPGNRFLLSHLAENLATKGYVVAAIDHTDSTYRTRAAFSSTLVNRPLDQRFVLDQLAAMNSDPNSFFFEILDASRTGLIGYSMGGYGAVITAGGGVTEKAVAEAAPAGAMAIHRAGTEAFKARFDSRFAAVVGFAPWGMKAGFWDAKGLAGIKVPMLYVAGSKDEVSGYEGGVRALFEQSTGVDRYLLTFENAGHNAAAPMPAPLESQQAHGEHPPTFGHYADPVWDTARMNNIGQHFVTAFFDLYLKQDASKASYLDVVQVAADGVWSATESGAFGSEHTYWKGFQNRTALGLRLEKLESGH